MHGILTFCTSLGLAAAALAAVKAQPAGDLKPGDPAPPFTLPGSDGKTHSLGDFKGRQPVVLAWYTKAFTSG